MLTSKQWFEKGVRSALRMYKQSFLLLKVLRVMADYGFQISITPSTAREALFKAKSMIEYLKRLKKEGRL